MRLALTLALPLLLAALARGQEASPPDHPAEVERIYVPRQGFQKVLRRHPRGALITEAELQTLLRLAGRRPARPRDTGPPAPLAATIERLTISGKVDQGVALLTADAVVSVLAPGQVGLPLPLSGIGLRGVWVDGKPARVIARGSLPEVLVPGGPTRAAAVSRRVTWEFALTVQPGEGRGSGGLTIPVPPVASGSVRLDLPGDLEVRAASGLGRSVVWREANNTGGDGRSMAHAAFGGDALAKKHAVGITWRPRRAVERVKPYVVADAQTLFFVQRGVVALRSQLRLQVFRAARDRFTVDLPSGFVVTKLSLRQGSVTHLQRGGRVEVRLDTPRLGRLDLDLTCVLSLAGGKRAQAQTMTLAPLGLIDVDRVSGSVGVARGPFSRLAFGAVKGLSRADLTALRLPSSGDARETLVRVYRRHQPSGRIDLTVSPLAPQVDLLLNATLQIREREARAIALYRYRVDQGVVFSLRATLPAGYDLEETLLLQGRRPVPHQLKRKRLDDGRTELVLDLERGLVQGRSIVLAVEAVAEHPRGVAGATLPLPRFVGQPATSFAGYLGLAPIRTFQLRGASLSGLTSIPAAELRRRGGRGIEWSDIVLGYRIEKPAYAGQVTVREKERRVSVEALAHHAVGEQSVATDAVLDLDVRGAPTSSIVLLYPPGIGSLAKVEGPGAVPDRASLGTNDDGWERFRIGFRTPVVGQVRLRVRFETKLAKGEGAISHRIPRVSVEGAVRERGALAVYSAGATELTQSTEGLRALDVTEVKPHPFRPRGDERPLLAYTHVAADYALTLGVTRHAQSPTLTAVAETLALETSVGPDGTARHIARFRVKNLANQYFALQLPEDAVLWSVVVDGQGVKPAGEGGERVIPIPTAGSKGPNQLTEVVATYTSQGSQWGTFGQASLKAPELRFGKSGRSVTDVVPVLKTTWALSLPDDYRVLEFAGNVNGQAVPHVGVLAVAAWSGAKRGPWPWLALLGLCGLAVAGSKRLQGGLLLALLGARTAGRNAKDSLGEAASSPAARKGVVGVVGGLAVVGLAVFAVRALSSRFSPPDAAVQTETARAYRKGAAKTGSKRPRRLGADTRAPRTPASVLAPKVGGGGGGAPAEKAEKKRKGAYKEDAKNEAEPSNRPRQRRSGRRPARKPTAPQQDPAASVPSDRAPAKDEADKAPTRPPPSPPKSAAPKSSFDDEDTLGGEGADGAEERDAPDDAKTTPSSNDGRGQGKGSRAAVGGKLQDGLATLRDLPAAKRSLAGFGAVDEKLMLKAETAVEEVERAQANLAAGGWGQVGLRSLVVSLSSVGRTDRFERPGGGAELTVGFVQEALVIGLGGVLALLGFVGGLVLPRVTRLHPAGLLTVALVTITAVPVLLPGSALTALLNALALGLALSAAALGLVAVARWWGTAPLSRLGAALEALSQERAA